MNTNKRNLIKDLYKSPMIPMDVCQGPGIADMVSVLIPTFNRDYILYKSLDSILAQDYPLFEIIVVDDGSSDKTSEVMERYLREYPDKIKYIQKPNGGLVSARNEGMRHASGEFIALQDSDDIWLQGKLKNQVAIFKKHPEVVINWTQTHIVNEDGVMTHENGIDFAYNVYNNVHFKNFLPRVGTLEYDGEIIPYKKGEIFTAFFLGNMVHPPVAMMRRSAIQKVGGLDQTYHYAGEDNEFFWRVSALGEGAMVEKAGMLYRYGAPDQMTKSDLHVFIALGYEKIINDRLRRYPEKFKSLGESVIQERLIAASEWVVTSEFSSLYGNKKNGLRAYRKLLQQSPKQAVKLIPFMIAYALPEKIRIVLVKLLKKII
jgi:glycosyltransferase involved in cell wall biosynthesis